MTSESSGRILSLLLLFAEVVTAVTSAIALVTTTWWLVFVAILACYALMWWRAALKVTDDGKLFDSLYILASLLAGYLVPIAAVLYVLATQDPPARVLTGAGLILVLVLLFLEHVAVKAVGYLRLAPLTSGLVLTLLAGLGFGTVAAVTTVVSLAIMLVTRLVVDLRRGTPPLKCGPQ